MVAFVLASDHRSTALGHFGNMVRLGSAATPQWALVKVAPPSLDPKMDHGMTQLIDSVLGGGGEMGARMRAFDWSGTPLGPVEGWPQSLRATVRIMLGSGYPMAICWGPDYTVLYNDAMRSMFGSKHPTALGRRTKDMFSESWEYVGPLYESVMTTGEAYTPAGDQMFPINRHGFLEECFFTVSYSPIRDDSGHVDGVFITGVDTTQRVTEDRQLQLLRDLASRTVEARNEQAVWSFSAKTIGEHRPSIPFALLYACRLTERRADRIGPGIAPRALDPSVIDFTVPNLWGLDTALDPEGIVVELGPRSSALPSASWLSPAEKAFVAPVRLGEESDPSGFLIVGIHPGRAFNDDYRQFLRRIAEQIAIGLANARAHEHERQRVEALERERESRMIVDTIPGLVAILSPSGEVEILNRRLLDYFGKRLEEMRNWEKSDIIHIEDRPHVIRVFGAAMASREPLEYEARLRRFDGEYRWFQVRGFPARDETDAVAHWYVLVTDIDDLKRAESVIRASERDLKLIIDTIPALAWSARPDGTADFFNQHYLQFLGLSTEQAKDRGWMTAVHPDDLSDVTATWQRLMSTQAAGEAEARLRRHDGVYRWFLFRANPLRDERGQVVQWYGINADIEDRKQAEAELRRAYDSFSEAQRLSHTGSFITDLVGDDHNWSEEAFRIFEFEPGSKVSVQRIRDVIHPDDLPSFESVIARGMGGEDVTFAFRVLPPDGSVKHVRGVAHVIERIAGRPLFVGALQDVTESRVAEAALDRARSELTHVTRVSAVSALTASIAHEVNQPLSGIITNAGTCLRMLAVEPPDVDGARETVKRTLRDGHRAADVLARLRALFSKREFALEPLDMNEVTQEVVALSRSDLERNRIALHSEFATGLPLVTGDRVQLQQVVMNLLRNASDAMVDVHDRPRQVLITTGQDADHHVRVTVRDAGSGLDDESMSKLFDPFYTTKTDGMGIGLSVSRSIIERHHGRLWAEKNDGPGATLAFAVPAASEHAAAPHASAT